jgi:hypothetical protein
MEIRRGEISGTVYGWKTGKAGYPTGNPERMNTEYPLRLNTGYPAKIQQGRILDIRREIRKCHTPKSGGNSGKAGYRTFRQDIRPDVQLNTKILVMSNAGEKFTPDLMHV